MKINDVKIAYIGGGSRQWARTFMNDISVQENFCGEVRLFDIDIKSAEDNKLIGQKYNEHINTKSKWNYIVCNTIEQALNSVDFVLISILPGTFDEMESDVHTPEKFGIYQSVGDSTGPGGIIRAMRTIPIYERFAEAIKTICPKAWVINFTNPMTFCTRTLYDIFPKIKAFGCCHEVFGTQDFLKKVIKDILNKDVTRHDIKVDVLGVNHFTWITKATYEGINLFPILDEYIKKHDINKQNNSNRNIDFHKEIKEKCWETHEYVKSDLYQRYGQLAAAGDRHLAEFVNSKWYLKDPETVFNYGFGLTPVSWRKNDLKNRINNTKQIINGEKQIELSKSQEEFTLLISAILGINEFTSNVNMPNTGQISFAPKDAVVETNATFSKDCVKPILDAVPLNNNVTALVSRVIYQQENVFRAIRERNLDKLYNSFTCEPLCSCLSFHESRKLFDEMVEKLKNTF